MLPLGKYEGETYEWVAKNDPSYAQWWVRTMESDELIDNMQEAINARKSK